MKSRLRMLVVSLASLLLLAGPVAADKHENFGDKPVMDGPAIAKPAKGKKTRKKPGRPAKAVVVVVVPSAAAAAADAMPPPEPVTTIAASAVLLGLASTSATSTPVAPGADAQQMFPKTANMGGPLRHVKPIRLGITGEQGRGLAFWSRF